MNIEITQKKKQTNKTVYLKNCRNFTKIGKEVTDAQLSVVALGIFTQIMCNHDKKWKVNKTVEQRRSGIGADLFNRGWDELIAKRFIYMKKLSLTQWVYIISNAAITDTIITGLESRNWNPVPDIPPTENQEPEIVNQNGGDNIDISNLELKNLDISNKEEKNINEINIAKIEIPINDESVDGIIYSGSTVNQNGNLILDYNAIDSLNNIVDENTKKAINKPSSIQEQVKEMVRNYVIQNKIEPEYVKDDINEGYSFDTFVENPNNMNLDSLFRWVKIVSKLDQYHGTASKNSIQRRLEKMYYDYVTEKGIDPTEAKNRFDTKINISNFRKIDQNSDIIKELGYIKMYTRVDNLINFQPIQAHPETDLDDFGISIFSKVD